MRAQSTASIPALVLPDLIAHLAEFTGAERRMGHSTVHAAMRYQHSTNRRDQEIAAEMSRRATAGRPAAER
jgi:hypothetical protein